MQHLLHGSSDDVLGLTISTGTTEEQMTEISNLLQKAAGTTDKIRLLVVVEGFRHMDPDGLRTRLQFIENNRERIERLAVLSNRVWVKSWVSVGGISIEGTTRYFELSQIADAWHWIRQ